MPIMRRNADNASGNTDNQGNRPDSPMDADSQITSIAHVIQLAVAPVFLLTGVAAFIGVISNRLGRIVDRARQLEASIHGTPRDRAIEIHNALRNLAKRARLANRALSLCVACAVLICSDIVVLFVGTLAGERFGGAVAVVFVLAMLSLIAALLLFLREVYLATRFLRIGVPEPAVDAAAASTPPT